MRSRTTCTLHKTQWILVISMTGQDGAIFKWTVLKSYWESCSATGTAGKLCVRSFTWLAVYVLVSRLHLQFFEQKCWRSWNLWKLKILFRYFGFKKVLMSQLKAQMVLILGMWSLPSLFPDSGPCRGGTTHPGPPGLSDSQISSFCSDICFSWRAMHIENRNIAPHPTVRSSGQRSTCRIFWPKKNRLHNKKLTK